MFERAGERKKKKQGRPFSPCSDGCTAGSYRQHQKMNIDGPFQQPFPSFMRGEPASGEIGQSITQQGKGISLQKITGHTKKTAQEGCDQLRFPFVDVLVGFKKFDIPLHNPRERNVPPAPKSRSSGTSHPSDSCFVAFVLNGDLFLFGRRKRRIASLAVAFAREQRASRIRFGGLDAGGQPLRNSLLVCLSEGGHRNSLAGPVNSHCFQGRII